VRYLEEMRIVDKRKVYLTVGDNEYPISIDIYTNAKFSLNIEGVVFNFERKYHHYGVYLYLLSHNDDFEWNIKMKY
tara:strand:- start:71 stop:298 length:228 start_codon:yes stop_codon:yes gene_type:complete